MEYQIIDVDQLRVEIGNPPNDPTELGHVKDVWLQEIIDRNLSDLEGAADAVITQANLAILPEALFDGLEIELNGSGQSQMLAEGDLPQHYYPFIRKCVTPIGRPMDFDPDIELTALTAITKKYRFALDRVKIFALPRELRAVSVWMPEINRLRTHLAPEISQEINRRIIQDARAMHEALVNEGNRLKNAPDLD